MNYIELINTINNEIIEDKEVVCWDESIINEINKKEEVVGILKNLDDINSQEIWE